MRGRGRVGFWVVRIEWLRRFVEKKSWFPIRASQVFETHLNRRRDFGGNLHSISTSTSRGREVDDIVFPTPALLCSRNF
jgi:hypothetical protein